MLSRFGVKAWHPDEFLLGHLAREPAKMIMAVRGVRSRLRQPPRTEKEYLGRTGSSGVGAVCERDAGARVALLSN